jgi:hypothetical protein
MPMSALCARRRYASDTGAMTSSGSNDPADEARAEVVGLKITGVFFLHDFIEVHMGSVILTGMTQPFGLIGCQGVGPASIVSLIGHTVDDLTVVDGEYVAIDSGENRLAFPIGGPTANGPESVLLVRPAQHELGIEKAMWVW